MMTLTLQMVMVVTRQAMKTPPTIPGMTAGGLGELAVIWILHAVDAFRNEF